MGQRLIEGEDAVCRYDSTEGIAWGPVFETVEHADDYVNWAISKHGFDIRQLSEASRSTHKRLHAKWFDERVDGETGELLDDAD